MEENNGLPKDISEVEDSCHVVLNNPIWEIPSNKLGSFIRRPAIVDRNYDYKLVAIFVLLGTHPGQNKEIPRYYRITPDNLTGTVSLLAIEEGKTIVIVGKKIIQIF